MGHIATTIEQLERATALIRDRGYTTKANAVDHKGIPVPVDSPDAVAFDLYGAVLKATCPSGPDDYTCQISDAFNAVVMILRDYEQARPFETGWQAALHDFGKSNPGTEGKAKALGVLQRALMRANQLRAAHGR